MGANPKEKKLIDIPEMRHEVIDSTIEVEELLDEIIKINFGFEAIFDDETQFLDPDQALNKEEIKKFREHILKKFSLPAKFKFVEGMAKPVKGAKGLPKDYGKKFSRFIEIRNLFAHTLAPKRPYKPGIIGISASAYERISKKIEEWENLYREHKKLADILHSSIFRNFYIGLEDIKELSESD